jgi:hypothetical protein
MGASYTQQRDIAFDKAREYADCLKVLDSLRAQGETYTQAELVPA